MDQQYYNQPVSNQAQQPNTLVFGILSLALCSFFGILSIIFGAIGRSKGNKFVRQGGTLTGASKAGYILSLLGIIFGIIALVSIVVIIAIAASNDEFLNALKDAYGLN